MCVCINHITNLLTSGSTSGSVRTEEEGPSISLNRTRDSCHSLLGSDILRTSYQQSWPSRWVQSSISTDQVLPTIGPRWIRSFSY